MSGTKTFYYFGDDEAYFKTLVGEFKKYSVLQVEFKKVFESEEAKIQSLFSLINRSKPQCVFIDFSKRSHDYLHLARILTRALKNKNTLIIGLLDYLSPPEVMFEGIATGVALNHIKSAEVFDVVFSVLRLLGAQSSIRQTFATAKYEETIEGGIPLKVGYVNHSGIHIETDLKFEIGEKIRIDHYWQKKRIVPSSEFVVKDISQRNIYYHFDNAVDLDFQFIDELDLTEELSPEEIQQKKQDREERIHYQQRILEKWLKENSTLSLEKKAKVLVIDRHFSFYNMQSRTDKHSYNIRCIESLGDIGPTIERYSPQVIAYALDLDDDSPSMNTEKELSLLAKGLKLKMGEDLPFLVIFNSQKNSKTLQEELDFPHIVASESDVSVELLLRMADVFEKKLLSKIPKLKKPDTVFIKSSNEASLAQFLVDITIRKLSEVDMTFESSRELMVGTNIRLTKPVEMFINVQESSDTNNKQTFYNGVIHCIGEVEKKELRKYVNSVIFREHDAKVAAEIDEFKRLNEEKLQEKEAKKTQEEES